MEIERVKQKRNTISVEICQNEMLSDNGAGNPLKVLTKRESIETLRKLIDKLSEPERIVIAKKMNGQNFTEIGNDLKVSKQHIRNTYYKAIKKLKASFSLLSQ